MLTLVRVDVGKSYGLILVDLGVTRRRWPNIMREEVHIYILISSGSRLKTFRG
jgi:hypothetical protein